MKQSSLAYSYGRQTHHNMNTLNPNLNIEDYYVENLLKQIQFLSLESKLLKERQSLSKGSGIMSLIDKENRPVVDHLLESGYKYKEMRSQLFKNVNELSMKKLALEAYERALMKKREYHDSRMKTLQKANLENKEKADGLQKYLLYKIANQNKELALVLESNRQMQVYTSQMLQYLDKMSKSTLVEGILSLALSLKSDEYYRIEQEDAAVKDELIDNLTKYNYQLNNELLNNPKYKKYKYYNKLLQDELKELEKYLSYLGFSIIEKYSAVGLAESYRDREIRERRNIEYQIDVTKAFYDEAVKITESKIERRKIERIKNSTEIKGMQNMIARLESYLEEVSKKEAVAHETNQKYKIEQTNDKKALQKMTYKAEYQRIFLNKIQTITLNLEREKEYLEKCAHQIDKYLSSLRKDNAKLTQLATELDEIHADQAYRNSFFYTNVTLKEYVKNVRVEELQSILSNNLDVNKTVGQLIEKWRDIQNFSRS